MDFDLFELDDDDDILSAVYEESTTKENDSLTIHETNVLPEFQCTGEDSIKAQFSADSFVKNAFIASVDSEIPPKSVEYISLTTYGFGFEQLRGRFVAQYLFGAAFINIQELLTAVQNSKFGSAREKVEISYYERRQHVTKLLYSILYTTQPEQWKLLQSHVSQLRNLLSRTCTEDIWKVIYFANSCKGNECIVPAYHLLHGLLEWKILDLCILYKFEVLYAEKHNLFTLKAQFTRIFDDLLICSLHLYMKKRTAELPFSTPFSCTCIKEFWLLLILCCKQWNTTISAQLKEVEQFAFWELFNTSMANLKTKIETFSLSELRYYEFVTWMLQSLIHLHGYRSNEQLERSSYPYTIAEMTENYEFVEQCTQKFLNSNPNEEQLRIHICLLSPILLERWSPRATIPMMLWEHFHKRLNSPFYIAGAAPSNLAVACGSGRAYLERYRVLLEKMSTTAPDANLCSYTLFILVLGKCLERLLSSNCTNQAQKLLGRIYSKFSLQKFLTLNETGIHHIIELFLILALCGDFEELAAKLRDNLLSITFDKVTSSRQISIMKGHTALLILFAEHHHDLSEYVTKLLQQLNSIRNDIIVSKILADSLLDIFKHSEGGFQRGEHLLIDFWLPAMLQNCTPVEQERALEAVHLIFVKLQASKNEFANTNSGESIKALHTHILPFLKQQYTISFSEWIPKLAADFCLHADTSLFPNLMTFFTETQTASRQAVPQFLLQILTDGSRAAAVNATTIMHVWLKSLVLLTIQHSVVMKLTRHIVRMPLFAEMTNLTAEEILQAKEPLCVFIAAVGKAYDAASHQHRFHIADNFNAYVRNFDKWLPTATETKLEQQPEMTFRFYSFLAIVIYNCPNIVYAKSKNNCFFHIAISRFVLPTSIQMGKPPEGKLTQLVHKILPVLLQGIGRLNFKTDAYIQKTLNDLIQKWTPLFKTISPNPKVVARPFIACILNDNLELSLQVCERLTALFLTTQRRQADPSACLVVSIFQEIITAITQEPTDNPSSLLPSKRLEIFLKGTCISTLEHIMMVDEVVPSRNMILELFRCIIKSQTFQNSTELQELFAEHLRIITKKHLTYYTFFYFDLLTKIAQISSELIANIMDFLLEEIQIVEQKNGAGEDTRIRGCLQRLRKFMDTEKTKKNHKLESR